MIVASDLMRARATADALAGADRARRSAPTLGCARPMPGEWQGLTRTRDRGARSAIRCCSGPRDRTSGRAAGRPGARWPSAWWRPSTTPWPTSSRARPSSWPRTAARRAPPSGRCWACRLSTGAPLGVLANCAWSVLQENTGGYRAVVAAAGVQRRLAARACPRRRPLRPSCMLCQHRYGAVAQLVAHLHGMEGVRGSNPLSSTTRRLSRIPGQARAVLAPTRADRTGLSCPECGTNGLGAIGCRLPERHERPGRVRRRRRRRWRARPTRCAIALGKVTPQQLADRRSGHQGRRPTRPRAPTDGTVDAEQRQADQAQDREDHLERPHVRREVQPARDQVGGDRRAADGRDRVHRRAPCRGQESGDRARKRPASSSQHDRPAGRCGDDDLVPRRIQPAAGRASRAALRAPGRAACRRSAGPGDMAVRAGDQPAVLHDREGIDQAHPCRAGHELRHDRVRATSAKPSPLRPCTSAPAATASAMQRDRSGLHGHPSPLASCRAR